MSILGYIRVVELEYEFVTLWIIRILYIYYEARLVLRELGTE